MENNNTSDISSTDHMNWIYRMLHGKAARILLLIPVANLLFVILFYIYAKWKQLLISLPVLFSSGLLTGFMYLHLPSLLFWLFVVVLIYVLAFLALKALRASVLPRTPTKPLRVVAVCILSILVLVVFLILRLSFSTKEIQKNTQIYFEAVATLDSEKLNSVTYSGEEDPQTIMQKYEDLGLDLSAGIQFGRKTSVSFSMNPSGKRAEVSWIVTVGETRCNLTVLYLKDNYGDGLKSVELSPISPIRGRFSD